MAHSVCMGILQAGVCVSVCVCAYIYIHTYNCVWVRSCVWESMDWWVLEEGLSMDSYIRQCIVSRGHTCHLHIPALEIWHWTDSTHIGCILTLKPIVTSCPGDVFIIVWPPPSPRMAGSLTLTLRGHGGFTAASRGMPGAHPWDQTTNIFVN